MIATDGAIIDYNVPGPERHGIPLWERRELSVSDEGKREKKGSSTFLTSNRFFSPPEESVVAAPPAPDLLALATGFVLGGAVVSASGISMSAMRGYVKGISIRERFLLKFDG